MAIGDFNSHSLQETIKSLRVMLFIETAGPGGAESVVFSLASGLRARGIYVVVLTLSEDHLTAQLTEAGIPWIKIESRRKFDISLPFRIARQIRSNKVNILHSHLLDSNFYGSISARIAGVPHLASEHGDVHHPQKKIFLKFKLQFASLLGSYFGAVSDYTLNKLRSYGLNQLRLIQLPNPVPAPQLCTPEECAAIRNELFPGVAPETFIWIHVANLRAVKDQKTLLRGFAKSLELSQQAQVLCLVGDGPERAAIQSLIEELCLQGKINLLGFRADARKLLLGANGFILSSRSEALPVSLLEAGAAGLVLISSKVGGVGEIIEDEKSGLLFRPGDSEMLAQKIREILDHPEERREYSREIKAFVERHFVIDRVVDEHIDLYRRLAL